MVAALSVVVLSAPAHGADAPVAVDVPIVRLSVDSPFATATDDKRALSLVLPSMSAADTLPFAGNPAFGGLPHRRGPSTCLKRVWSYAPTGGMSISLGFFRQSWRCEMGLE
jgi:hypothetical protein